VPSSLTACKASDHTSSKVAVKRSNATPYGGWTELTLTGINPLTALIGIGVAFLGIELNTSKALLGLGPS
jgi:hypothetical protein